MTSRGIERERAAQRSIRGIAIRHEGRQAVEPAAEQHEHQPAAARRPAQTTPTARRRSRARRRHIVPTKVRRSIVISIGTPARRARARRARGRRASASASRPRSGSSAATSVRSASSAADPGRRCRCAGRWSRASSARFSSESESAHSAIVSPKPFGACGAHSGCRSCRSAAHEIAGGRWRVQRPQRRDQPLLRRPELPVALRPRLGRVDQRRGERFQVAAAVSKRLRQPRDTGRRRIVGHEVARQLGGDERGRRWMPAQVANGALALRRAPVRVGRPARSWPPARATARERRSRAAARRIVGWPCATAPTASRLRRPGAGRSEAVDRPAGQHPGQLAHVLLRVAAVDAQGVELEQLAGVVLVQPAAGSSAVADARAPGDDGPIDWKASR